MRIVETYRTSEKESYIILKDEEIIGDELERLNKDMKLINKIDPIKNIFYYFKNAYTQFKDWENNQNETNIELKSLVSNYIIKTVQLVEHWESFIKRNYIHLEDKFEKLRTGLYENSFAYRMLYNLRNLVTHTLEYPYNRKSLSIEKSPELILDKDYLINVHSKLQGRFRKEIEQMQEKSFDLVKIINVSYKDLIVFHEKVSNLLVEDLSNSGLIDAAYRIINFYNKYQENNGLLALTDNEIDETKLNQKDYRQNFSFTYIPYDLAYFIAMSAKMNFRLIGTISESSALSIPIRDRGVIYKGKQVIQFRDIKWTLVCDKTFHINKGQYLYSSLYMLDGLSKRDYRRHRNEFIGVERNFYNSNLEDLKMLTDRILNIEDEVIIIYFEDESAEDLKIMYSGSMQRIQEKYLGSDWTGFNLGDRFQLEDEKVRFFSKSRSILSTEKRDVYFIGPMNLNSHRINYQNLKLKRISKL